MSEIERRKEMEADELLPRSVTLAAQHSCESEPRLRHRHDDYPPPFNMHFPRSPDEAKKWKPYYAIQPLAPTVLAVAKTRIEGKWAAYIDSVHGVKHSDEMQGVLSEGCKLREEVAVVLFPHMKGIPYAS